MKFFFLLLGVGLFSALPSLNAQTGEEAVLTWSAENYAPAEFKGRVLPSSGTRINMSLQLVRNGSLVLLRSTDTVRWFVDGAFVEQTEGGNIFTFTTSKRSGAYIIKTEVVRAGNNTTATISIPVAKPEIVIDAPIPGYRVRAGSEVALRALPYFFNAASISDFVFTWEINGVVPEGTPVDPDFLTVEIPTSAPPGSLVEVRVTAENKSRNEKASKRVFLTIE